MIFNYIEIIIAKLIQWTLRNYGFINELSNGIFLSTSFFLEKFKIRLMMAKDMPSNNGASFLDSSGSILWLTKYLSISSTDGILNLRMCSNRRQTAGSKISGWLVVKQEARSLATHLWSRRSTVTKRFNSPTSLSSSRLFNSIKFIKQKDTWFLFGIIHNGFNIITCFSLKRTHYRWEIQC